MDNPYRARGNFEYMTPTLTRLRRNFIRNWIGVLSPDDIVLDIGERNPMSEVLEQEAGHIVLNTSGDLETDEWVNDFADGSIHAIFCLEVLEHLRNPLQFLKQVSQKLKEGGLLYITTPKVSLRILKQKDHFHEYTEAELINILQTANFRVCEFGATKSGHPRRIFWQGFRPLLRALLQKSFYVRATAIQ